MNESERIAELETELARLKTELEEQRAVNDAQAASAAAAEQAEREMEQFAYVASHDLKEPLRTVANYIGLMRRRYGKDLPEAAHDYLQTAQDATVRMRALIDNLLEYSRAQQLDAEVQSLSPAAERAVANLAQLIQDNQAEVSIGALPQVRIDETQLTRVFQNLIANALKYRAERAPRVQISASRERDVWRINVQDNGMGIAPEDQARIFQMFSRLHRRDEIEGSGIGLNTVQRIVESHGGSISVSSVPGEGSVFSFTLPLLGSEEAA